MQAKLLGKVNFPVMLAPMVGLSHVAFRMMLRDYLPVGATTLWPTEMLNSRKIPKQDLAAHPMSLKGEGETELWPQILGNEPEPIKNSIAHLKEWGAEAIDINMGCPVKKALRHNYGVALMGDIKYASDVVRMAVDGGDLPVSVKIRAGLQNDQSFLKDFVLSLEDAGADWLTLHPRIAGVKRRGRADWEQIAFITDILNVPVVGNGDVQTCDDVFAMLEQTGCYGVMVGRALTARPWLLSQVGEKLGFKGVLGDKDFKIPQTPQEEASEYGRSLLKLLIWLKIFYEENPGLIRFKFYVKTSHVWLNFGHSFYSKVRVCKTYQETKQVVESFFSNSTITMTQKTDLRE